MKYNVKTKKYKYVQNINLKISKITIEMIQKEVCTYYNVEKSELISKKRHKQIVVPRQVAMYLCRSLTDASFPQIGDQFGGRDHTTVIHSVEKMEREIRTNAFLINLDIQNFGR